MERDGERIEITISSRFENIELVQVIAEHLCENAGMDEDGSHWIGMAVREAVANAIKHGNKLDVKKKVNATFELDGPPFDAAVLAGNVLVFVAPGSEVQVLTQVAAHVRPDGVVVTGFATDRDWAAAGLVLEHRFATWDLRPWRDGATFAVSVFRRPT